MTPRPLPGWHPNPSGAPGQRYLDGRDWTAHHRAAPAQPSSVSPWAATPPPVPFAVPTTVVVTGPNHALPVVLTLLTFWACGGWAWVWLIVALSNRRQVRVVAMPAAAPYRL